MCDHGQNANDMRPDDVMELEAIIREERHCGVVHLRIGYAVEARGRSAKILADELADRLGLTPIGTGWRGIDRNEACDIITGFLERDLAYHGQLMTPDRARQLAEYVFTFAGSAPSFLTNIHPWESYGDTAVSWVSLSSATFDHAVAFIGSDVTGMIWVEDED